MLDYAPVRMTARGIFAVAARPKLHPILTKK
jgi:hypothetical protein